MNCYHSNPNRIRSVIVVVVSLFCSCFLVWPSEGAKDHDDNHPDHDRLVPLFHNDHDDDNNNRVDDSFLESTTTTTTKAVSKEKKQDDDDDNDVIDIDSLFGLSGIWSIVNSTVSSSGSSSSTRTRRFLKEVMNSKSSSLVSVLSDLGEQVREGGLGDLVSTTTTAETKSQSITINGFSSSDCILLGAIGDRIPNSEHICSCTSRRSLDLTCYVQDSCVKNVNHDPICGEITSISFDLHHGLTIQYCTVFPDEEIFEQTCVTIALNQEGTQIASCDAIYGSNDHTCRCNVCSDSNSINIDCSRHYCRAETRKCQAIDLMADTLVPVVPAFLSTNYICEANFPEDQQDDEDAVDAFGAYITIEPPEDSQDDKEQQQEDKEGQQDNATSSSSRCSLIQALESAIPHANDLCSCKGEQILNCEFDDPCNGINTMHNNNNNNNNNDDHHHHDDATLNICANADSVDMYVDLSKDAPMVGYCTEFTSGSYEQTCMHVDMNRDLTVRSCTSGTYGGQPCTCILCNDRVSMMLDCSEYHPNATSGGCQPIPSDFSPFIPAFQPIAIVDDSVLPQSPQTTTMLDNTNSIQSIFPNDHHVLDGYSTACELLQVLEEFGLDTSKTACDCNGPEQAVCTAVDTCSSSNQTCAKYVDISIDTSSSSSSSSSSMMRTSSSTSTSTTTTTMSTIGNANNDNHNNTNNNNAHLFSMTNCVTFDDDDLLVTCISAHLRRHDMKLTECTHVEYGGHACSCSLCHAGSGTMGLRIDCRAYNEDAITDCQVFGTSQALQSPFVPDFRVTRPPRPSSSNDKDHMVVVDGATLMNNNNNNNMNRDSSDDEKIMILMEEDEQNTSTSSAAITQPFYGGCYCFSSFSSLVVVLTTAVTTTMLHMYYQ